MINKNFYRKTNDKKILHKVGKQWKVVSVALLMAIGGGAAVAATNNTSANADANNGLNNETTATVQSLEQNPAVGQSAAPAKSASSAAPKSNMAPKAPQLSLNPEANVNGNNASAAYYHAMTGYDNAVINYYKGTVQSYVNSVNTKLPKQASALNSANNSAENQQKNDQSLASSYSATAAEPNWSAEVSNIASQKSGIDASAYIETVGYNVSNNANTVSSYANELSGASDVASLATLISEINGNGYLSAEYVASDADARANSDIANNEANNTSIEASNVLNDSVLNRRNLVSAIVSSANNKANNAVAVNNSAKDYSLVVSLAGNKSAGTNEYSEMSNSVSSVASAFGANNPDKAFTNEYSFNGQGNNDYIKAYKDFTSASDELATVSSLNSSFNAISGKAASYSNEAMANSSASVEYSAISGAISSLASSVSFATIAEQAKTYAGAEYNNFDFSSAMNSLFAIKAASDASTSLSQTTQVNGSTVSQLASSANVSAGSAYTASNSFNNKQISGYNSVVNVSTGTNLLNNEGNGSSVSEVLAGGALSASVSTAYNTAKTNLANASTSLSNEANTSAGDIAQLLWDTNVQQYYGSLSGEYTKEIASAKAAVITDSAEVSSADSAYNTAKAASASASTAAKVLNVLGNNPTLADIYNENLVSSADGFYNTPASTGSVSAILANINYAASGDSAESSAVSEINSAANQAGQNYTSASNNSESYVQSTDANFVLASSYAQSYGAKSGNDQAAVNSASNALNNFYIAYAGDNYGSAEASLVAAQSAEPNDKALANGYGVYVYKHEPHFVTVGKQLVMHSDTNYNSKNDKHLATVNKGAHLEVLGVGFDDAGDTRFTVNFNGTRGFITANPGYVRDTYLEPGVTYNVTFAKDANQYSDLAFHKATGKQVKAGDTVKGTAVLNDDGYHYLGLTRLQLDNGNYVTTRDSYLSSVEVANANGKQVLPMSVVSFWK